MLSWRTFKAYLVVIGLLSVITPLQSIPTKSKLLIIPEHQPSYQKQLQLENNALLAAYALESTLLELLDQLYEHTNYWQKKQALAKKATWHQHTRAALDSLQNEINYQASQLANINELINANEQDRKKINVSIPHDCLAYEKEALDRVAQYEAPSHISRHCVKYTIGAACAAGALVYCNQNREALASFASNAKEATSRFIRDYAYKPLKNSYDIIFNNSADAVGYHEKTLRELLGNYYAYNCKGKPAAEVQQTVDQCIKSLELPKDVQAHFVEQSKSPAWNTIMSRRLGGQFVSLNQILLHLELLRAQNIHQGQKLNLELLVAIPTAVVGYGAYRITKGAYSYLAEKNYEPIKQNMLRIERLLNQFNNDKQTITDTAKGKIIYAVHQLTRVEHLIPVEQRESFFADLAELYAPSFSIKQKLRTIDRMYRTYNFLPVEAT